MVSPIEMVGIGILIAFLALVIAFVAHFCYRKGKMAGINQMCAIEGWETRDLKEVTLEAYLDLMDVRIAGIIPLAEAFDLDISTDKKDCKKIKHGTKVKGLLPTFHKHMLLINRKDPERFVAVLSATAPFLISIKEGANKLTPQNLPSLIRGLGELVKNVGQLMKLMPEIAKAMPKQVKGDDAKSGSKSNSAGAEAGPEHAITGNTTGGQSRDIGTGNDLLNSFNLFKTVGDDDGRKSV